MAGRTLFDKIWNAHVVARGAAAYDLLYVDRVLMYEGGAASLALLEARNLTVRNPRQVLAVADHFVGSVSGDHTPAARRAIANLAEGAMRHGLEYWPPDHPQQGIVHVVGPESGFTLPGSVMVCSDSHTSTNGAFGSVAFGVGATELANVLGTQCLWMRQPRGIRVTIDGAFPEGVGAKDLILAIIGRLGAGGAVGCAVEFAGSTVRAMGMEGRMTLCNMAVEAGARFGVIAPDDVTFEWLEGRRFAPQGETWTHALARWRNLSSDEGAAFDREIAFGVDDLAPMVTWGSSPQDVAPVTANAPDAAALRTDDGRLRRTLDYMGLQPGERLEGLEIDRVFIGSCTNSRLDDLRSAAAVLRGRRARTPGLVVPGSQAVRRAAEQEGLDRIFTDAGLVWGAPGCSMCCALNGDGASPGERVASTSNRNFEGRQGPGVRTHLMSPAMAAAAAVRGSITDVRRLMEKP